MQETVSINPPDGVSPQLFKSWGLTLEAAFVSVSNTRDVLAVVVVGQPRGSSELRVLLRFEDGDASELDFFGALKSTGRAKLRRMTAAFNNGTEEDNLEFYRLINSMGDALYEHYQATCLTKA